MIGKTMGLLMLNEYKLNMEYDTSTIMEATVLRVSSLRGNLYIGENLKDQDILYEEDVLNISARAKDGYAFYGSSYPYYQEQEYQITVNKITDGIINLQAFKKRTLNVSCPNKNSAYIPWGTWVERISSSIAGAYLGDLNSNNDSTVFEGDVIRIYVRLEAEQYLDATKSPGYNSYDSNSDAYYKEITIGSDKDVINEEIYITSQPYTLSLVGFDHEAIKNYTITRYNNMDSAYEGSIVQDDSVFIGDEIYVSVNIKDGYSWSCSPGTYFKITSAMIHNSTMYINIFVEKEITKETVEEEIGIALQNSNNGLQGGYGALTPVLGVIDTSSIDISYKSQGLSEEVTPSIVTLDGGYQMLQIVMTAEWQGTSTYYVLTVTYTYTPNS